MPKYGFEHDPDDAGDLIHHHKSSKAELFRDVHSALYIAEVGYTLLQ
jgi:hypothetical protein